MGFGCFGSRTTCIVNADSLSRRGSTARELYNTSDLERKRFCVEKPRVSRVGRVVGNISRYPELRTDTWWIRSATLGAWKYSEGEVKVLVWLKLVRSMDCDRNGGGLYSPPRCSGALSYSSVCRNNQKIRNI